MKFLDAFLTDLGEPGRALPLVELCWNSRALIEHQLGVTEYGQERICVRVKHGQISIRGKNLRLGQMNGEKLVILGKIEEVGLEERE
ncbi:MAG: YabP/YqfC family sporulation protein [Firmicutes bacterium]|nr:YabP/YqfC family sporulation protein [Bacillota bacterium]